MTDREKILKTYMSHSTNIFCGYVPLPSTVVKEFAFKDFSLYKVRKIIKELVADGMLKSERMVDYDDYSERPLIINGYVLTEKAKETEEYRKNQEREIEIIEQCFGCGD